jgi:hypothetical protein
MMPSTLRGSSRCSHQTGSEGWLRHQLRLHRDKVDTSGTRRRTRSLRLGHPPVRGPGTEWVKHPQARNFARKSSKKARRAWEHFISNICCAFAPEMLGISAKSSPVSIQVPRIRTRVKRAPSCVDGLAVQSPPSGHVCSVKPRPVGHGLEPTPGAPIVLPGPRPRAATQPP